MENSDIRTALDRAVEHLLSLRSPDGTWTGELSSSALSTAIAAFALAKAAPGKHTDLTDRGLNWLITHANENGSWGDTTDSPSNISRTLLCWSALSLLPDNHPQRESSTGRTEAWLTEEIGGLAPADIVRAVLKCYGNDRTFSVPILTMCAMAGRLGNAPDCWELVPQIPFELAVLPHQLFRLLRMHVVSYAIPALISMGLARHVNKPEPTRGIALVRRAVTGPVLRILRRIQPSNGGFLEAAPLTGFVAMSMAAAGHSESEVTRKAVEFLKTSVRPDGSWPIDSNLGTWVTTLSIKALSGTDSFHQSFSAREQQSLCSRLISQQSDSVHPYTHAAPGGWAWTGLPGAVPDADDTAGALLAIFRLSSSSDSTGPALAAAARGLRWLIELQNSDGGIPTFCRGWGKLPFDRSSPDISAHALLAFDRWYDAMPPSFQGRLDEAMHRIVTYLQSAQSAEGCWIPLWFGNQHVKDKHNPVYGTALVTSALRRITPGRLPRTDDLMTEGCAWLAATQNNDGGWGGDAAAPSSIEETALAVSALSGTTFHDKAMRGTQWLVDHTAACTRFTPTPIGLYFANLWYSETLYPIIFTIDALNRVLQ
jgi:squalene-hopene/tetraprenyl-beta-curcumene cyclase